MNRDRWIEEATELLAALEPETAITREQFAAARALVTARIPSTQVIVAEIVEEEAEEEEEPEEEPEEAGEEEETPERPDVDAGLGALERLVARTEERRTPFHGTDRLHVAVHAHSEALIDRALDGAAALPGMLPRIDREGVRARRRARFAKKGAKK